MLNILFSDNTFIIVAGLVLAVAIGGYLCYTKIEKKPIKKKPTKKTTTKKTTTATKKKCTKKK